MEAVAIQNEPAADAVQAAAAEVETWRQRIADLESELQRAEEAETEAEKARREVALGASLKDASAGALLKKATQQVLQSRLDRENLQIALQAAKEKLAEAEEALQRAKRQAALRRFKELCGRRRELDEQVDRLLDELAGVMQELYAVDREQGATARSAGIEFTPRLRSLLTDALSWRLGGYQPENPHGLVDSPAPPAYRGRLVDIDTWAKPESVPVEE